MNKKTIKVIYTGGTIGGKEKPGQNVLHDVKTAKFEEYISNKISHSILDEDFQIEVVTSQINKFSEEIHPSDWSQIASAINKAVLDGVSGIVVAHGTDTMAYTASAISYMVQGVKIPIAFTGSNKPIADNNTDAVKNIEDAILFVKQSTYSGVFLVFSGSTEKDSFVHLGTRVRKVRFADNCYESINVSHLAQLKRNFWISSKAKIKLINKNLLNTISKLNGSKEYSFNNKIEPRVHFFKIYPGFEPSILENLIQQKKTKGIILELYNSGTGCTTSPYSLLPSLNLAKQLNIPVFATSQHFGAVRMDSYGSAQHLKEAGVIPLNDMITEAATTKLMWLLPQTENKEEIKKLMLRNILGEISE
jgi:L-asparaginase type I